MDEEARNKQLLRALLAAVDAGDLDAALRFYSPDYFDHDASEARSGPGPHAAILRGAFLEFYSAFSETRHVIEDILAEGDRVAARIAVEARHTGPIQGLEPSGQIIRNDSIVIYRFEGGLIRERWCRERHTTRFLLERPPDAINA
jgi:ketosteroid isomerase-like protein